MCGSLFRLPLGLSSQVMDFSTRCYSQLKIIFLSDGKYIYLETSAPAKYGDFAQMTSRLFKPTKSRTLKFFTYMYGRSVNYLKVLIKTNNSSKEIWKLEGNQGKRWLLARIDFSCPMSYQVIAFFHSRVFS